MENQYKNWHEISLDYLDWYYIGFSYIDSIGFLFYTPAVMVGFLLSNDCSGSTGLAISWWYNRIQGDFQENKLENLLSCFGCNQITILIKFLYLYGKNFIDKRDIDTDIIVNKIKLIQGCLH